MIGPRFPWILVVTGALALSACGGAEHRPAAVYVGGAACAECHEAEASLWEGSHHDLAMQEATEQSVLGDFDDATFTQREVVSTFYRRGDAFFVQTQGPEGAMVDYEVAFAFGVTPLQQYLIAFPGGRYQVLGVAWDSRPEEAGGQRWFHLYPDEEMGPESPLHWTRPSQNWNTVCAECHSTNLEKGYDPELLTYTTTWSDLDVSCEACHGPGSLHVAQAEAADAADSPMGTDRGFADGMHASRRVWTTPPGVVTASLSDPDGSTQVDGCAPCHARRARIADGVGESIHDNYLVSLLRDDLYHADGQIREEVYEYGSFLQSKMYAAGVICSDCHEPHSLQLQAPGNGLCVRCHAASTFDTAEHHFHDTGSTGAQCVACHMPETTYMQVDPRRDHSIRVPRPDLTPQTGAPNACSRCHVDRSVEWAAQAFVSQYGPTADQPPHFGQTIHLARQGDPAALAALETLAADDAVAPIVRATALSLFTRYPRAVVPQAIRAGLTDANPLVRIGALQGLEAWPTEAGRALAEPLLYDPVRAVRVQAARELASRPMTMDDPPGSASLAAAWGEAERAEMVNADHPSAWVSLGNLYLAEDRVPDAERAFRQAIRTDATDVVGYLNLADLHRATRRDDLAAPILSDARSIAPNSAEALHALGLLRVREGDLASAMELLSRAAELQPTNPRFPYVYGVARASNGDVTGGIQVLVAALTDHPFDGDILAALAAYSRGEGDVESATTYARRLVAVRPDDPDAAEFLRRLVAAAGR